MKLRSICLLAAVSVTAHSASAQPAKPPKPIVASLVLSAPTGPVKSGSKVELSIALTNVSEGDISIDLWEQCNIDIWDEDGILAPETALGEILNQRPLKQRKAKGGVSPASMNSRQVYKRFKPGDAWEWHQDITARYEPLPPGKYTVQAINGAYVWNTQTGSGPIKSNVVTLTVVP